MLGLTPRPRDEGVSSGTGKKRKMVETLPGWAEVSCSQKGPWETAPLFPGSGGLWIWRKEGCRFLFLVWALWPHVFRKKDEGIREVGSAV